MRLSFALVYYILFYFLILFPVRLLLVFGIPSNERWIPPDCQSDEVEGLSVGVSARVVLFR